MEPENQPASIPAAITAPSYIFPTRVPHLKIKVVSLAAEARLIRAEERKRKDRNSKGEWTGVRFSLHQHRTREVRQAARHAQLAYAFLRGIPYARVEPLPAPPAVARIHREPDPSWPARAPKPPRPPKVKLPRTEPDWAKVRDMVKRFGIQMNWHHPDAGTGAYAQLYQMAKADEARRFEAWKIRS